MYMYVGGAHLEYVGKLPNFGKTRNYAMITSTAAMEYGTENQSWYHPFAMLCSLFPECNANPV